MEMSGERQIDAAPSQVWAALNDPDVLKASISGCESMEKTSDTEFEAVVVQKVGPVKARFTGQVELTDIVEGESYRITGRGKGGAAGGATGGAHVALEAAEGGTLLRYEAEAKVTGKIAQLGSRLIGGFAKKMADDFFDRFKEQVEDGAGSDGAGNDGAAGGVVVGGVAAETQVSELESATREAAEDMAEAVDSAGDAVAAETSDARERFDEFSDKVDEETRGIAAQAASITDNVTSKIGEAASDAYDGARDAVSDVFEKGEDGKSKFDETTERLDDQSRDAAKNLSGPVDKVTDAIGDVVGGVFEDAKKAIEDSPPGKKSFWKRLFGG